MDRTPGQGVDPTREVVLIDSETIGWAASGRNGGFCEASLVHGESNGETHLPKENARLTELGAENLAGIAETIRKYNIDCDFWETGVLNVATEKHQVEWLKEEAESSPGVPFMDADEVKTHINSPLFQGGIWHKDSATLVHPAKLAWGLRRVCLELGVKIFEHTKGEALESTDSAITVRTGAGTITAQKVALATNVFPSLLKRHRLHTIPVYDYALMTEPLTEEQREAIGWHNNSGLADMNNRFHYSRPTIDENGGWRILFGGYDAVYHYGRTVKPEYDHNESTYRKLAAALHRHLPAARRHQVLPCLGRRDRHLQPFLRLLRHLARRPRRLLRRLHRPGRRRHPLRRPRHARPPLGAEDRAHRAGNGQEEAAALPAGTGGLDGREADDQRPGQGRPQRGQARPVPEGHGRRGHGVRLVSTQSLPHLRGGEALRINRVSLVHEQVPADQAAVPGTTTGIAELGTIGGTEFGIWEMGTGSMYDVEAEEIFVVTAGSGTVVIDALDGHPAHTAALVPGTIMRLSEGMKTTWTVTEPLRKIYFTPTDHNGSNS